MIVWPYIGVSSSSAGQEVIFSHKSLSNKCFLPFFTFLSHLIWTYLSCHTFQPIFLLQSIFFSVYSCLFTSLPFNITFIFPSLHLFFPFVSSHSHSVAPRLSGRPEPPHLPTTSAAPPCLTVPISPEGWESAAHSTQASSGVPGTSRGLLTLAGPPLHRYRTATARPGGRMAPQASSASSHRSLCAGEWKERPVLLRGFIKYSDCSLGLCNRYFAGHTACSKAN